MHVIPLTSMRFSPPHLPDMYVHCLGWPLALNCPSSGPSNYSHSLESAWPIGCFPYILPEESPGLQPAPLWRQLPPPSAFFPALFILPGVHGNSWICKLILFTNFEVLSAIYISKNFFCLIFFFPFLLGLQLLLRCYTWYCPRSQRLCSFFFPFLPVFWMFNFYSSFFKDTHSFFCPLNPPSQFFVQTKYTFKF